MLLKRLSCAFLTNHTQRKVNIIASCYHADNFNVYGYKARKRTPSPANDDEGHSNRIKHSNIYRLVEAYRKHGHKKADLDPLGLKKPEYVPELEINRYGLNIDDTNNYDLTGVYNGSSNISISELVSQLEALYCGHLAVEFSHLESEEEREWFSTVYETEKNVDLSPERKVYLANLMLKCQAYDVFLANKFTTVKRYGGEGGEISASNNVPKDTSVDLDYNDNKIHVSLIPNPSHLEYYSIACIDSREFLYYIPTVSITIIRKARGKLQSKNSGEYSPDNEDKDDVLCVQVHGDASFSAQGVISETFSFAECPHFNVGGSVHVIVNNQIGFTTESNRGRSSRYSSDLAKINGYPVVHVNADNPEVRYPIVHVNVDNLEARYPEVHVNVDNPEVRYPVVHVIVDNPEVRYPVVHVNVDNPEVRYPVVHVNVDNPEVRYPVVHVNVDNPEVRYPKVCVNVDSPEVRYPVVHVNVGNPEVRYPVVHVNVDYPEVRYPVVHVNVDNPEVRYPVIHVNVDNPEVRYPVVHVNVDNPEVRYPVVHVNVDNPEVRYPVVHVNVDNPEVRYPVVHVNVDNPEVRYPVVHVNVDNPEVRYPVVHVNVDNPEVRYPVVHVNVDNPEVRYPVVHVNVDNPEVRYPVVHVIVDNPEVRYPVVHVNVDNSEVRYPVVHVNVDNPEVRYPVVHVIVDNPEDVVKATTLAMKYRQMFKKDVIIDFICYRRWGHNEIDDPTFTQPIMYNVIQNRRSIPDLYKDKVVTEGLCKEEDLTNYVQEWNKDLSSNMSISDTFIPQAFHLKKQWSDMVESPDVAMTTWDTGMPVIILKYIGARSVQTPESMETHSLNTDAPMK
ncbi:hypothetical protein KUTeg_014007 [Tegillarca granosa]|uniref:Dehydrogenase E1 component domain-containing protein n=1 Tax=Tegillarca granosa TaxID=220873 RepID=A0ABQ9F0S5_TEGGR|nr:hypothetical protein KUTeg_014007 [Tegillarca granosa]